MRGCRAMGRPATTRDEAMPLIAKLLARQFEGELPALADTTDYLDRRAHLWRMPLAATLPLHGRSLFAPSTLSPEAREQAAAGREDFFGELGAAVGVSARVLVAAVRAGRFPLEPPCAVAGYEYVGSFNCTGQVDIADPCHLRRSSRMPASIWALSFPTPVDRGTWHAFMRAGTGDAADRTGELAVIHAEGFAVAASEELVHIGVDGGMMGVFDQTCPPPSYADLQVEGVVQGLGAVSRSGYGDGIFPVYAGKQDGVIRKLRLAFLDEDDGVRPEVDATLPQRPSKRYAVSTTFAAGDTIDHPKFGTGRVIRCIEGKIEVEFDDEIRTLIHGKR